MSRGHICLLCLSYYSYPPPCPPSIPLFLSLTHLLHAHPHKINPPVQKDGWDVPEPQVLLYLWVLGILHYTIQTCTVSLYCCPQWCLLWHLSCGIIQHTINLPVYKQPSWDKCPTMRPKTWPPIQTTTRWGQLHFQLVLSAPWNRNHRQNLLWKLRHLVVDITGCPY